VQLSIFDVAFAGFRTAVKRPVSIVVWTAVMLLTVAIVGVGSFVLILGVSSLDSSAAPDFGRSFLAVGVIYLVVLCLWAVLVTAAYRMYLRPDERAFAYLRFGGAELRMIGLFFVLALLSIVGWIGLTLVGGILSVVIGQTLGGVLNLFVALGVWAYFAVRLSLAGVVSFVEGGLGVTRSWELTRGHFWSLFAVYLILAVLVLAVAIGLWIVQMAVQAAVLGASAPAPGDASLMGPALLLALGFSLLSVVVWTAQTAFLYVPHAAIYRALTPTPVQEASEVFA